MGGLIPVSRNIYLLESSIAIVKLYKFDFERLLWVLSLKIIKINFLNSLVLIFTI